MKQNAAIFLGVCTMIVLSAFKPGINSHKVNTGESTIVWEASKVTGKHMGTISLKSGELKFDGSNLVGGQFEVDVNSIECTDLSGEYADKLVNHLKSDDFFSAAKHPIARFVISKVTPQGSGLYKIDGNLTIKGITKPIRFNANVKEMNGLKTATAEIVVDRAQFDIRYGSGSFFDNLGDKTIHDDFKLKVSLSTMN